MIAALFPGQGTLRVGMAGFLRVHPAAARVFAEADELLSVDVRALCARGPAEALIDTLNAQPVVTVLGAAALAVLRDQGLDPQVVAGHSVGELAALHAAGVMDFTTLVGLVAERARLMASVGGDGVMLAVLGLSTADVERLARLASRPGEPLVVALDNGPGNVVVSGARKAADRCAALAQDEGASAVRPLKVSGAFHSPLLNPIASEWADVVASTPLSSPACPVVPNATGRATRDVDEIRAAVVAQVTGRVQWGATCSELAEMGAVCVEAGDSKALTAMARAAEPPLLCVSMADPRAVRRLLAGEGGPLDLSRADEAVLHRG